MSQDLPLRKIIHVDMDCFYAAIEIRDNPTLQGKPVAVGGSPNARGVLCTCNYIARSFGIHSAMATAYAMKRCPHLIVLPVNMAKYREVARNIQQIFFKYTALVEPISLDEAYLDVTNSSHFKGSATWIAKSIREEIQRKLHLTASAGVAPNKFLAKVASGWKKPDSLFVIPPKDIEHFIKELPVKRIHGVGKVTAEKLHHLGLKNCLDLQKIPRIELVNLFGKFGQQLYDQCRGIDHRPVEPNRIRKSLSVEKTFDHDIAITEATIGVLNSLYQQLMKRLKEQAPNRQVKNQYIKIKFSDFKQITLERISHEASFIQYEQLLFEASQKRKTKIRLLGIGVHFGDKKEHMPTQAVLL